MQHLINTRPSGTVWKGAPVHLDLLSRCQMHRHWKFYSNTHKYPTSGFVSKMHMSNYLPCQLRNFCFLRHLIVDSESEDNKLTCHRCFKSYKSIWVILFAFFCPKICSRFLCLRVYNGGQKALWLIEAIVTISHFFHCRDCDYQTTCCMDGLEKS